MIIKSMDINLQAGYSAWLNLIIISLQSILTNFWLDLQDATRTSSGRPLHTIKLFLPKGVPFKIKVKLINSKG